MFYIFFVQILKFTYGSQIFCGQYENLFLNNQTSSQVQIFSENNTLINKIDRHLQIQQKIYFAKNNYKLTFGEVFENSPTVILLYQKESEYLIQILQPSFIYQEKQIQVNMDQVYEKYIHIQYFCNNIYSINNFYYLICNENDKYIIYYQERFQDIVLQLEIIKIEQCKLQMKFFMDKVYFIQQDCLNWIIHLYSAGQPLEFINEINHTSFDEELRDVQFSMYFLIIYLHFDHFIYELSDSFDNSYLLYEEKDDQIIKLILSSAGFTIILKDFNYNLKVSNIGKQYSYSINQKLDKNFDFLFAYKTDYLVGLNDNNLLYLSFDTNEWETYNLQMNKVSNFLQSNILLGFDDKNIILINRLKNLPFFSCSEINGKSERLKIIQILSPQFSTSTNYVELVKVDANLFQLQNYLDELYHQHEFTEFQFIYSLHLQSFIIGQPAIFAIENLNEEVEIINIPGGELIDCKIQMGDQFFWWKIAHLKNQYYIIYQTTLDDLIIKNCNTNITKNLGVFEKIEEKFMFVQQNQITIYLKLVNAFLFIDILDDEQDNIKNRELGIKQTRHKVDKDIMEVQMKNRELYFQFKDCSIYHLDRNLYLLKEVKIESKCNLHENIICIKPQHNFGTIQLIKSNFGTYFLQSQILFRIQDLNIIDIFQWGERDNLLTLIYYLKNSDEILIGQFIFDNFKLTKMFDFPLHDLKINVPLKFNYNKGQIAILASKKGNINLVKYILIYKLSQTYTTCLKQIIQTDSQFFQDHDLNSVIYQNENHFFLKRTDSESFSFKLKNQKKWSQVFQFKLIGKPILDQRKSVELNMKMELINGIFSIQPENQTIYISEEQLQNFDPRLYVTGIISSISSSEVIIHKALQVFADNQKCQLFLSLKCIRNLPDQLKPYFEQNFIYNQIYSLPGWVFQFENFLFIIMLENQIEIYKLNFNNTIEVLQKSILIENQLILDIILKKDILFIICNESVQVYRFENTFQLLEEIRVKCKRCKIQNVKNENHLYIIYHIEQKFNFTLFKITDQKIQFLWGDEFKIAAKIQESNFHSNQIFKAFLNEYRQIVIMAIAFQIKQVGYVLQFNLDMDNFQQLDQKILSIIRYHKLTKLEYIVHLDNNELIAKFSGVSNGKYLLSLYNLSDTQNYQMLDSIQDEYFKKEFQFHQYNSTSLLVVSNINKSDISLLVVQSYKIEWRNYSKNQATITLTNQLSTANMTFALIYKPLDKTQFETVYLIAAIILINLLIIFLIYYTWKFRSRQRSIILNQSNIEIEL